MELVRNYNFLFTGLLLLGACSLVLAKPSPSDALDNIGMQSDDYYDEYSDDKSAQNHQAKTTVAENIAATQKPYFRNNEVTVMGIIGKNITMECNAKNLAESNVILWYKNKNLLTNGKQVLKTEYILDYSKFALTVVNATEESQGEYFCEILPQKIRLHTTLVVAEHPIEAIIPESSKSAQESCSFRSSRTLIVAAVLGILLFLRI